MYKPRPAPKYRHEHKYEISAANYYPLRQKLRAALSSDPNSDETGRYMITSLYFDNCFDKALAEKVSGVSQREKFRFRYYGTDTRLIFLEKKQKVNGLCLKTSEPVSLEQVEEILSGRWQHLTAADHPLLAELAFKMNTQLLRPRTVVRYWREAYIYRAGNVRITFDSNITTGLRPENFLERECPVPAEMTTPDSLILEVKYDEFMPDMVRKLIAPHCTRVQAFSKYAQCRAF
ncbi:MAG: polyphosphate polymerase domain-containing protein [Firmicutes bacterium]|nr:polyphosphate polymerase domain-containing protein [Bacillota bacterium]